MRFIKNFLKRLLGRLGYSINRNNVGSDFVRFVADKEFRAVYERIQPYSILNLERLYMLWQTAKAARNLKGDVAEVGVFRGGSALLIAEALKPSARAFHLFDTFSGMPRTDSRIDRHKEGDFSDTSLQSVQKLFAGSSNIHFYPGLFPGTAASLTDRRFAFVYLDADIYDSTKAGLEFFYSRLVPGGFIVLDDYRGKNTPGVERALTEFLQGKPELPIVTAVAQCLVIKQ